MGPMFPLDQQDIDHLAPEGWLRIASLVAMARHILGLDAIPLPRGLAARALLVLKPAEAMARRGLLVASNPAQQKAFWQLILLAAQQQGNARTENEAQIAIARFL